MTKILLLVLTLTVMWEPWPGPSTPPPGDGGVGMTPQDAVKLSQRFADAITLLIVHGIISDAERHRAYKRLDKWAKHPGLKQKGT